MNPVTIKSFRDELQKIASYGGFLSRMATKSPEAINAMSSKMTSKNFDVLQRTLSKAKGLKSGGSASRKAIGRKARGEALAEQMSGGISSANPFAGSALRGMKNLKSSSPDVKDLLRRHSDVRMHT